ncbi:MAG: hypothetical protein J5744_05965 [Oscillospiraceae bacterium]|nr:hypothetical protein [Oscillospiraceae bacterium]
MKIKCEYCGTYYSDIETNCPNCGGPNAGAYRTGNGIPKTIEELKAFCTRYRIPLDKLRFFIGEDYREPKAYGIFRDTDGNYVVYKNKADGSRSVRYRGTDEEYAVNELYQKLKSEFANRRNAQAKAAAQRQSGMTYSTLPSGHRNLKGCGCFVTGIAIMVTIWIILGVIGMIYSSFMRSPSTGYYYYGGDTYYNYHDDWYYFDQGTGYWYPTGIDSYFENNYDDYYQSYSYDSDYGVSDFYDSGYYDPYDYSSSWDDDDWDSDDWDWDSDSDWDWDSDSDWDWDSGSDWDSDW